MSPIIPFETALEFLVMAYIISGMLLLMASEVCLAVIESLEEVGD